MAYCTKQKWTFADPHLLAPDFVKMLEDDDYVYFFLREQAVEYINCGKVRETFFFQYLFSVIFIEIKNKDSLWFF